MASTRFIIAVFAVLISLAFTSAATFSSNNDCWTIAVKLSGCGDDATSNPDLCLCRSAGIESIFKQAKEYCAQNGDLSSFNPEQVCADVLHPHKAAPAVAAFAAHTPLAPGFCALPGTPCAIVDDVAEKAEPPTIAALPVRTFTPHPLPPGFCALPGAPCAIVDDVAKETEPPTTISLAARTAAPHTPLAPGFCALPGAPCAIEDDAADVAEPPTTISLAARTETAHPLPPGFCALPGAPCAIVDDMAEEAELTTSDQGHVDARADTETQPVSTPSFKDPRPYGLSSVSLRYPKMAPERRANDDGPLSLQEGKIGNSANSKLTGGLNISLGFVIGWIAALMAI